MASALTRPSLSGRVRILSETHMLTWTAPVRDALATAGATDCAAPAPSVAGRTAASSDPAPAVDNSFRREMALIRCLLVVASFTSELRLD